MIKRKSRTVANIFRQKFQFKEPRAIEDKKDNVDNTPKVSLLEKQRLDFLQKKNQLSSEDMTLCKFIYLIL